MGKIVAVANQKGGVGKTTTAVNLAACLGRLGKRVLLFDADAQGNATSGVGIDKRAIVTGAYEIIIEGADIKSSVLKTSFDNLYVVASNINLAGAEIALVSSERREYRIKDAIYKIKDDFDYIICDCPPSLGLITLNVLAAADTVLLPIQCEYYALEGLSQLVDTMRRVKKALNPELELEGVLLTMFDGRTNLGASVVQEVKKYFPQKVYKSVITRSVRLSEAPSFGEPIIYFDKASKGAYCYMEFAQEFLRENGGR